jgi:hypothetical protein
MIFARSVCDGGVGRGVHVDCQRWRWPAVER